MKTKIVNWNIEITEQDANMGVTDRTDQYIDESKVQKYRIKNR